MPAFREEEEDHLFDEVARMADRMGLKGEKRATYIDDHMIGGGYERVQTRESYAKPQNEDEDDGGTGRWGLGGRSRQSRQSGSRGGSRDDDDRF
jgi:hypothetical protein